MSKNYSRLVKYIWYNFLKNPLSLNNKISQKKKVNTNEKNQTAGIFNIEIMLKEKKILHIAKFNFAKMKAELELPWIPFIRRLVNQAEYSLVRFQETMESPAFKVSIFDPLL